MPPTQVVSFVQFVDAVTVLNAVEYSPYVSFAVVGVTQRRPSCFSSGPTWTLQRLQGRSAVAYNAEVARAINIRQKQTLIVERQEEWCENVEYVKKTLFWSNFVLKI